MGPQGTDKRGATLSPVPKSVACNMSPERLVNASICPHACSWTVKQHCKYTSPAMNLGFLRHHWQQKTFNLSTITRILLYGEAFYFQSFLSGVRSWRIFANHQDKNAVNYCTRREIISECHISSHPKISVAVFRPQERGFRCTENFNVQFLSWWLGRHRAVFPFEILWRTCHENTYDSCSVCHR